MECELEKARAVFFFLSCSPLSRPAWLLLFYLFFSNLFLLRCSRHTMSKTSASAPDLPKAMAELQVSGGGGAASTEDEDTARRDGLIAYEEPIRKLWADNKVYEADAPEDASQPKFMCTFPCVAFFYFLLASRASPPVPNCVPLVDELVLFQNHTTGKVNLPTSPPPPPPHTFGG